MSDRGIWGRGRGFRTSEEQRNVRGPSFRGRGGPPPRARFGASTFAQSSFQGSSQHYRYSEYRGAGNPGMGSDSSRRPSGMHRGGHSYPPFRGGHARPLVKSSGYIIQPSRMMTKTATRLPQRFKSASRLPVYRASRSGEQPHTYGSHRHSTLPTKLAARSSTRGGGTQAGVKTNRKRNLDVLGVRSAPRMVVTSSMRKTSAPPSSLRLPATKAKAARKGSYYIKDGKLYSTSNSVDYDDGEHEELRYFTLARACRA